MAKRWFMKLRDRLGRESIRPLEKTSLVLGRADPHQNWKPDFDFLDQKVSRRHARLLFQDGVWMLEDIGSKYGTLVGQEEIKERDSPTRIDPGIVVAMGDSSWTLLPAASLEGQSGDVTLMVEHLPVFNYAVHHCGLPFIGTITVRNSGQTASPPMEVEVDLEGYSTAVWRRQIKPLPPGGTMALTDIRLHLDCARLEGLYGRRKAKLTVNLGGRTLVAENVDLLGFYEFSFHPDCRQSLACFVQPAHPLVQTIVLDARNFIPPPEAAVSAAYNEAETMLRALYLCLQEYYTLAYVREAPSFELNSQVIRPPHRIIQDVRTGRGEGTCIDLVLLLAACLENLNLQPLVVFIKAGSYYHVLLGCWRRVGLRFEPVITDYDRLRRALAEKMILVEATGVTRQMGLEPMTYEESQVKAREYFQAKNFRFAIDIAAARQTATPLQFPLNPEVMKVIREAEAAAREEPSAKLETRHLLARLLQSTNPRLRGIFTMAGLDPREAARASILAAGAGNRIRRPSPSPTLNYRRVMEDARIIAGDLCLGFVEEEHLLYALLLSQSKAVDAMLEEMGCNRRKLKSNFEELFDWHQGVVQSICETGYGPI